MRRILVALLSLVFFFGIQPSSAATAPAKSLQIYFIDVEGGQATLVVTPSGQSLLIDTGWSGYEGRDSDRIVAAAHQAGLKQLDYVLITHYHRDHVGGGPQLMDGFQIRTVGGHRPYLQYAQLTRPDHYAS